MTLPAPKKPLSERPYLAGALFWIGFSFISVLIRGVRWDENYEFAQVILGQIAYPEGHPLSQYVRGFYSLQTYAMAGLMYFLPGPLVANLLRNWIFLLSSTVPVFLLGALFSRRQLVGHLAVVFVLLQVHVSFYSSYPIHVWPGVFSNGPVGMGYMLGTLWALLDRRFRLAGLLLGLAPAIHLGQFPPLLATAVLCAAYLAVTGRRKDVGTLIRFALPGLAICVGFALFLRAFSAEPPTTAPYFTDVEPMVLWRTYMERYASHRAIPYTTGHLVLLASVIVGIALPLYHWKNLAPAPTSEPLNPPLAYPRAWAALYCVIASVTVWVIMAVQAWMGADVPFLLAGWLPYRLMNHVAPVLIPLLLAICYDRDNQVPYYLPVLLLAALLAPLAHLFMTYEFIQRYIAPNAFLFFLVTGAAAGSGITLAWRGKTAYGIAAGGCVVVLLAVLVWYHQFGAACTAVGIVLGLMRVPWLSNRALQVSSTVFAFLLLIALFARQYEARQHLDRSSFHVEVAEYLAERGEEDAMLLVPHSQIGDQMRFGHPVMADQATFLFCGYRPALAPAVNALFEDFYGMSLDPDYVFPEPPLAWHQVWPAKSLEEWQALATKYDVRYVVAPPFMVLPLERLGMSRDRVLYRIPDAQGAPEQAAR